MTVAIGIPAQNLTDEDLERELAHAHRKRHDTFLNGSAHALANHTRRVAELEQEYPLRFPDRVVENVAKSLL